MLLSFIKQLIGTWWCNCPSQWCCLTGYAFCYHFESWWRILSSMNGLILVTDNSLFRLAPNHYPNHCWNDLPWITIFGSWVRRFANNFHEWRNHEWKFLANRITSDPKIVIHGNECIIIFLKRYFMSLNAQFRQKQSSIVDCRWGRPFLTWHCDVTAVDLWRHPAFTA